MEISVIYIGDINAPNGASKVVKSFLNNTEEFKKNEIILKNVYSSRNNNEDPQNYKNNKRSLAKANLKKLLSKSILGNLVSIYLQYFRNASKAVKKYHKSNKTEDVIIFHDILSCYLYHKKDAKKCKKTILVLHTNGDTWKMLFEYFPKIKRKFFVNIFNRIEDYACKKTNKIIFVSKTSAENFKNRKPSFSNKVGHVYNGISKLESVPKDKKFNTLNLVSVGTLNSRKAQDLILKSLDGLKDKAIKLSLIGDGDKYSEYYDYSKKNNLLDRVRFLGSRNDVEELLQEHNVFIMSSKDEGLPISIIEAMKYGLPIIATNVGGIKELIDGNGILVEPNLNSIKSAIERVNSNKDMLISMSKKSLSMFNENFEVSKMIENYSNLVKEVSNEQ